MPHESVWPAGTPEKIRAASTHSLLLGSSAEETQNTFGIGQPVDATLSTTDTALFSGSQCGLCWSWAKPSPDRSELVRTPVSVTLGQVTADDKAITFSGFCRLDAQLQHPDRFHDGTS